MLPLLVAAWTLGAEPHAKQLELLRVFREEFVAITPGQGAFPAAFRMGRAEGGGANERPVHEVAFKYSFAVAKYEVPQNLYEAVMGDNPSKWKGPRNSVEMVSYDDALKFCARATEQMRSAKLIAADEVVRLPSEAEWEYVARAGSTTVYSFGDDPAKLGDHAWFTGNAAGNDPPVGAKKPNAWGLYDAHGYLWEWCLDAARDDYAEAPADGSPQQELAQSAPTRRLLRGGSWKDPAAALTSTHRRFAAPDLRDDAVGLRCVLAKP